MLKHSGPQLQFFCNFIYFNIFILHLFEASIDIMKVKSISSQQQRPPWVDVWCSTLRICWNCVQASRCTTVWGHFLHAAVTPNNDFLTYSSILSESFQIHYPSTVCHQTKFQITVINMLIKNMLGKEFAQGGE